MIALAAFAAGALASALLWRLMRSEWRAAPPLQRTNYRGHPLPIAAGVMVVLAAVLIGGAYTVVMRWNGVSHGEVARGATVAWIGTLGFGFIGLLDDLAGATATKGFAGHLRALRHGTVTTGLVKLVLGGVVGLLAAPQSGSGGVVEMLRGGLLIALGANLANLFDRAPGRVIKFGVLGAAVIAVLGAPGWWLTGPMLVLGAGAGMLLPDLREQCMLGDTGANVLGAAVGFGLALALNRTGEWIAVGVLLALNVASERISFTKVIDATPPLRWVDRLGALPERRAR
jgi:UDP-GlcNAc:undecaprenyl-phosphate/decaprenyl-phosphate GlcNAc-1-phosphate transferase